MMLEEIYTEKNDKTFYVGEFKREVENFNLYELIDQCGRFESYSLINRDFIRKVVSESDYLAIVEKFKSHWKEQDLFNTNTFDSDDFDFKKLKNKLIITLYGDEEFLELSKVANIQDKAISLSAVNNPVLDTLTKNEADLSLDNFAMIEVSSVQLDLLSKFLG